MAPEGSEHAYELFVADGLRAGERFALRPGRSIIGRDGGENIVLPDDGVSRRHAQIDRHAGHVVVQDLESTNGTWVNGARLTAARTLALGDVLRVGAAALRLEGSDPAKARPGKANRQGISLGRVAWVAVLVYLLLALVAFVTQWLTNWTALGYWLALPVGAVAAALIEVLREILYRGAPQREETATYAPPATRRRQTPVGVAVASVILLVGGGGVAAAFGIGTLSAYITGNEAGTERLAAPVEDKANGITTTVNSVEHTSNFTRVRITVKNGLRTSVTMPLFSNATLSAEGGLTLDADPFRSSFSETIAPNQIRQGVLVFHGHMPVEGSTATLAFAHVFAGGPGPDSIIVDDLALRPL